jgi:hypothetical protein
VFEDILTEKVKPTGTSMKKILSLPHNPPQVVPYVFDAFLVLPWKGLTMVAKLIACMHESPSSDGAGVDLVVGVIVGTFVGIVAGGPVGAVGVDVGAGVHSTEQPLQFVVPQLA